MGARGKKLQCFGMFFFLSLVDSFCYFLCSSGKIHLVNLHSITWINWMKTANENERGRHCHCHRRRTKRRCFFPLSINVYFVYPFPVYHESTTNNNILYPILYAWCALLCSALHLAFIIFANVCVSFASLIHCRLSFRDERNDFQVLQSISVSCTHIQLR